MTVILAIVAVTTLLALVLTFYFAEQQKKVVTSEAQSLETFLQGSLAPLLWNYDNSTIRSLAQAVLLRQEVSFLKITQDNGQTIILQGQAQSKNPLFYQSVEYHHKIVGSFEFQISPGVLNNTLIPELWFVFFFVVFFIAVFVWLGPWISRFILARPLIVLSEAVERFSHGDFSTELLEKVRVHEFLPFTKTLWDMGLRLQAERDKWKLLNEDLENRVEKRTKALSDANEKLEKTLWELRQTQDYLVRSEKLATLGQLVAGIAHELNTPLGAIDSSYRTLSQIVKGEMTSLLRQKEEFCGDSTAPALDLLERAIQQTTVPMTSQPSWKERRSWQTELETQKAPWSEGLASLVFDYDLWPLRFQLTELLQERPDGGILVFFKTFCSLARSASIIGIASEKASAVVASLRDYARREEVDQKQEIDLVNELETILALFRNKLAKVEVVRHFEPRLSVMGSKAKLNQVWINLINNALHAMNYEGKLELSVRRGGENVLIEVTDSGQGIAPENFPHIFEPFFTTKPPEQGMGLGLDICRQIVENQGGTIFFESVPGRTTFRVTLKSLS
ncbi:MAG: hypothetical protein HKM06_03770 [Spirochaetales bacterium]|nr:hypothetical protein [Spirochaetales bacterium]